MNAVGHIVSSATAGVAVGAATGSFETGAALFLAGWSIDLDHFMDFASTWGVRESLVRMSRMGVGERNRPNTAYMILHGYEVSALLWALAAWAPSSPWLLGAAIGHLLHLLLDQATNLRAWSPTYFLAYRGFHRFSHDAVFPDHITRNPAPPAHTLFANPSRET